MVRIFPALDPMLTIVELQRPWPSRPMSTECRNVTRHAVAGIYSIARYHDDCETRCHVRIGSMVSILELLQQHAGGINLRMKVAEL